MLVAGQAKKKGPSQKHFQVAIHMQADLATVISTQSNRRVAQKRLGAP